ncbi:MAG: anti-sigma factor [Acidobacteriaceae bacterium]|jgi:anti-sigma-K factor RskA
MSPNQPNRPHNLYPISTALGPRHTDPDDLALYAMQLLPSDDAAIITRHLENCTECRAELAHIHDDLAACAVTVDLESPPAAARQRLIQQVAREKKIVPAPPAQAQAQPEPPRPIPAFGRSGSVFAEARPHRGSAGRSLLAWSGWGIAAGLAVALGFLYGDRSTLRETLTSQAGEIQRLNADAATAHQLMDALTDPRAVRVTLTAKPQPRTAPIGGVTYNPEKGSLVFLASDLNPLQALKTYELWVIPADGSAPIPAGTFHPDDQGNASVIMPDLPKGVAAKAFGVTIEPDGGSESPTLPIILAGS